MGQKLRNSQHRTGQRDFQEREQHPTTDRKHCTRPGRSAASHHWSQTEGRRPSHLSVDVVGQRPGVALAALRQSRVAADLPQLVELGLAVLAADGQVRLAVRTGWADRTGRDRAAQVERRVDLLSPHRHDRRGQRHTRQDRMGKGGGVRGHGQT